MAHISKIIAVAGISIFTSGLAWADAAMPHQRNGLWESSMSMMGHPFTTQSCVTEESQAKMSVFSSQMRQKNCSANAITHNMDGSWTSTSTCKFGPAPARTTITHVTGDMNSKITEVISSNGGKVPDMTMTLTWMGACKPGMKGGDVVMSDGTKINVLTDTPSH